MMMAALISGALARQRVDERQPRTGRASREQAWRGEDLVRGRRWRLRRRAPLLSDAWADRAIAPTAAAG